MKGSKQDKQNDKLETLKKELLGIISHIVRTPLSITKEGLSLILDEIPGELNSKQRKIIVVAKENIDRLTKSIEAILKTPCEEILKSNSINISNPKERNAIIRRAAMKKKILLVDDEPDFLEVMKQRLQANNYEVITALNGKEALAKIKQDNPDAILLDIMLPKPNGLEVLNKIRRKNKNLPIFMLTAFSNEKHFKLAKKFGASGFIVKTSSLQKEIDNISSALRLADKYKPQKRKWKEVS